MLLLTTLSEAACLDATPVVVAHDADVAPREAGDRGDVGEEASDSPCRACIEMPERVGVGCGDKLVACRATPTCGAIYECAWRHGCVTLQTQNESVSCALPCAAEVGAANAFDESVTAAIALTTCFHTSCAPICEGGH